MVNFILPKLKKSLSHTEQITTIENVTNFYWAPMCFSTARAMHFTIISSNSPTKLFIIFTLWVRKLSLYVSSTRWFEPRSVWLQSTVLCIMPWCKCSTKNFHWIQYLNLIWIVEKIGTLPASRPLTRNGRDVQTITTRGQQTGETWVFSEGAARASSNYLNVHFLYLLSCKDCKMWREGTGCVEGMSAWR